MAVFPKNEEEARILEENKNADIPSAKLPSQDKKHLGLSPFRKFRYRISHILGNFFKKIARSISSLFKPAAPVDTVEKTNFGIKKEEISENKNTEKKDLIPEKYTTRAKEGENPLGKEFISLEDADYTSLRPQAVEDIVKEFEEANDLLISNTVNDKIRILDYLPNVLLTHKIVTFDTLSTVFEYISGFETKYDTEKECFIFGDKETGFLEMDKKGNVSVPSEVEGIKNPLKLISTQTKGISEISYFLSNNENYISVLTNDISLTDKSLQPIKDFVKSYGLPDKYINSLQVYEYAARKNPELMYVQNLVFSRISKMSSVSALNKYKFGFKDSKEIIPYMKNPLDYLKVVSKAQEFCLKGISPPEAFTFASCYITNDMKEKLPYGFVSPSAEKMIDAHILKLKQEEIKTKDIVALVKSYNNVKNLTSLRVAIESIDQQLKRLVPVSKILSQKIVVDYTPEKIAYEIQKDLARHSNADLIDSYNAKDVSPLNIYLNTLTAKEFNDVISKFPKNLELRLKDIIEQTGTEGIYTRTEDDGSVVGESILTDNEEDLTENISDTVLSEEEKPNEGGTIEIVQIRPMTYEEFNKEDGLLKSPFSGNSHNLANFHNSYDIER